MGNPASSEMPRAFSYMRFSTLEQAKGAPGDYLTLDADGAPEKVSLIRSGYLTRVELVKLWKESGGVLHRGSMKNISRVYSVPKFDKIKTWDEKILRLLKYHQINLANPNFLFCIIMQHPSDGRVHGYLSKLN